MESDIETVSVSSPSSEEILQPLAAYLRIEPWTNSTPQTNFARSVCASPISSTFYLFCYDNLVYANNASLGDKMMVVYAGGRNRTGLRDGHKLTEASFDFREVGTTVNMNGTIFVAEAYSQTIRKIEGDFVSTIAGFFQMKPAAIDGHISTASFTRPTQIAYCESSQTIFVLDAGSGSIRSICGNAVKTIVSVPNHYPSFAGSTFGVSLGLMRLDPCESKLILADETRNRLYEVELSSTAPPELKIAGETNWPIQALVALSNGTILVKPRTVSFFVHLIPSQGAQAETASKKMMLDLRQELRLAVSPTPFIESGISFDSPSSSWEVVLSLYNGHLILGRRHSERSVADSEQPLILVLPHVVPSLVSSVDLRPLLAPSCPVHALGDLKCVDHSEQNQGSSSEASSSRAESDTSLLLHRSIIEAHGLDPAALVESASLASFNQSPRPALSLLYATESIFQKSEVPNAANAFKLCMLIESCFTIGISAAIPLRTLEYLLPFMPIPEILILMTRLAASTTLPTHTLDLLASLLSSTIKKTQIYSPSAWVEFRKASPESAKLLEKIITTGDRSVGIQTQPISLSPTSHGLYGLAFRFAEHIRWQRVDIGESEENLAPKPGFFTFVISGVPTDYLHVPDLFLNGYWMFVNLLMESQLMESHTRVIELPADFPPAHLLAILRALHGLPLEDWARAGNYAFQYAIDNAPFYYLCDAETKEARNPFQELLRIARFGSSARRRVTAPALVAYEETMEEEHLQDESFFIPSEDEEEEEEEEEEDVDVDSDPEDE